MNYKIVNTYNITIDVILFVVVATATTKPFINRGGYFVCITQYTRETPEAYYP